MIFRRSIRKDFLIQLIFASSTLILTFSFILYFFIKQALYEEKYQELISYAQNIVNNKALYGTISDDAIFGLSVEIIQLPKQQTEISKYELTQGKHTYLTLMYPYNVKTLSYLKLTKEVSKTQAILDNIINYIFTISAIGFGLVVIYAVALSKILIRPLTLLNNRLANMNEHLMQPLKTK